MWSVNLFERQWGKWILDRFRWGTIIKDVNNWIKRDAGLRDPIATAMLVDVSTFHCVRSNIPLWSKFYTTDTGALVNYLSIRIADRARIAQIAKAKNAHFPKDSQKPVKNGVKTKAVLFPPSAPSINTKGHAHLGLFYFAQLLRACRVYSQVSWPMLPSCAVQMDVRHPRGRASGRTRVPQKSSRR